MLGIETEIPDDMLRLAKNVRQLIVGQGGPHNYCGIATEILELLHCSLHRVHGTLKGQPHWWSTFGGIILDVTGDQFNGDEPILMDIVYGTKEELQNLYVAD